MDTIEAIVWGQIGQWGTNKHPPLSGNIAYLFYDFFGANSLYFLSQICVLIGFIYIYKFALHFVNKNKAILSVILLEGIAYYGFLSIEYNVNVLSLALWPMATYYFYLALKDDKLKDFILFGILIGLNLLNKYTSIILLFSFGFYLLKNYKYLKNYKFYLSGLIGLLIIIPHLVWLQEHSFFVFDYFKSRSGEAKFYGHFWYPVKFILAQILVCLFMLINYFWQFKKTKNNITDTATTTNIFTIAKKKEFLFYTGILPTLLCLIFPIISGKPLKSMWGGSPLLYLSPVLLFVFFPAKINEFRIKKNSYIFMLLTSIGLFINIITSTGLRSNFDYKNFVNDFDNIWKNEVSQFPLKFVSGDIWFSSYMSLYSQNKPKVVLESNIKNNPWFTEEEKNKYGVLIFGKGEKKYSFEVKNYLGKTKKYNINYTIILPQGGSNE